MNYFEYNGISSLDMGLRIESKNVFSAPKYESKFQSIPGRDGDLILPNGRFPNVQITYSVFLPARTKEQLAEKIAAVKAWLFYEPDRYHELRDSYDTTGFRKAVINTQLDIEDQLNKIGVFTVSFSCMPFRYLDEGREAIMITSSPYTITNPTVFRSKPYIRVNGNGEGRISINIKKYAGEKQLTNEMVLAFIKKVLITDGEHIEIQWNFSDVFLQYLKTE